MALDGYYYPSWPDTRDSTLGAMDSFLLPPASPTTNLEFPYSDEEDQQLLLQLHGFLSDSNTTNIYPDSSSYLYQPQPQEQLPFLLDCDGHCSSYQLPGYDYFMPEPPPKRQERFHSYSFGNYSDLMPPPPVQITPFPPPPPPEIFACTPHAVNEEGEGSNYLQMGRKEGRSRAGATAQSARDRRKKISDKTMELGRLVPGAKSGKMNTSEMLQHAFKYVRFMQSQLSLLQLLPQEQMKKEELQIVASSAVQEKLYMKGKCLVPLDLLNQLAANGDLYSVSLWSQLVVDRCSGFVLNLND